MAVLYFLLFSTTLHAKEWVVTQGTYFDVLLESTDSETANRTLEKAESVFNRILDKLGEDGLKRKWEKERHVKIKIYDI